MVSNIVSYIMLGLVVVAMAVFLFTSGRKQKKAQDDYMAMLDSLRPGVKVKMISGLLGRIKDIREEAPNFKTVTLNIGDDKNVVEMTFVIDAVQGIVNEEAINKLKMEKMVSGEETTKTVETTVNIEDAIGVVEETTSSTKKTAKKRK